jgi:hypothetical protein
VEDDSTEVIQIGIVCDFGPECAVPGGGHFEIHGPTESVVAFPTAIATVVEIGTSCGSDTQPPTITIASPADGAAYILNQAVLANYSCEDPSGVSSCVGPVANGNAIDTSTVGAQTFTVTAQDAAGNTTSKTNTFSIQYASSGTCYGEPGHVIRQPINADGSSVFKQGSTVPAKFRVCDANGVSIGTAGVVTSFKLVQRIAGTVSTGVNEDVVSTTPDTAFRWSASDQQWIFNINTKNLMPGNTYVYKITLNDDSDITFQFGMK